MCMQKKEKKIDRVKPKVEHKCILEAKKGRMISVTVQTKKSTFLIHI